MKKNVKAIKFLLENNSNPHLENEREYDGCDLAKSEGITEFDQLLNCDIELRKPFNRQPEKEEESHPHIVGGEEKIKWAVNKKSNAQLYLPGESSFSFYKVDTSPIMTNGSDKSNDKHIKVSDLVKNASNQNFQKTLKTINDTETDFNTKTKGSIMSTYDDYQKE